MLRVHESRKVQRRKMQMLPRPQDKTQANHQRGKEGLFDSWPQIPERYLGRAYSGRFRDPTSSELRIPQRGSRTTAANRIGNQWEPSV